MCVQQRVTRPFIYERGCLNSSASLARATSITVYLTIYMCLSYCVDLMWILFYLAIQHGGKQHVFSQTASLLFLYVRVNVNVIELLCAYMSLFWLI